MIKKLLFRLPRMLAILFFLSYYFFISLGSSITVPSDENVPVINEQIQDLLFADVTSKSSGTIADTGGKERSSRRTSERPIYYTPSTGDPIKIAKKLVPSSNGYLLGDSIGVFVEIDINERDLNSIQIKEFLSEGIDLVNISRYCYRLVDSNEFRDYVGRSNEHYFMEFESGLSQDRDEIHRNDKINIDINGRCCIFDLTKNGELNDSTIAFLRDCMGAQWAENGTVSCSRDSLYIYDKNNSLNRINFSFNSKKDLAIIKYNNLSHELKITDDGSVNLLNNEFNISIDRPRANYRYVYWYFVRSNNPGNYKSITHIIASGKEPRDYSDTDSTIDINVNYPEPEVNLRVNKLNLLKNEELNVVYEINFDRLQKIDNNRTIKFKQISDYYTFINKSTPNVNDNKMIFKANLDKLNTIINKTIIYPHEGEYFLPPIWIDDKPYLFQKEKISVENRFMAFAPLITFIFAIISFLMKDILIDFISPSGTKVEGNKLASGTKAEGSKPASGTMQEDTEQKSLIPKINPVQVSKLAFSIWTSLIVSRSNISRLSRFMVVLFISILLLIIIWFVFDQPIQIHLPWINIKILP